MPQAATTKSMARAFRMMKAIQALGFEWGEDYWRAAGVLGAPRMRWPGGARVCAGMTWRSTLGRTAPGYAGEVGL